MTIPTLDLFRLDGRAIVVTGASSGLGAGFARSLAGAGADLVLAARRIDRLDDLAHELRDAGAAVEVVAADVADPDACRRVAEAGVARFGALHGLVNNAGLGSAVSALKETPDGFRRILDVNLHGAFWMAQAVAAHMPAGSAIVNVASVLGHIAPRFPQAAYAASKSGLLGLSRDLAGEWARRGIRVNALSPGYFASEMTDAASGSVLRDMVAAQSMLGRFGEQPELDAALLFLISPASSYVTGTELIVDGGLAAY